MHSLSTRRLYPVSPLASLLNLGRDFDRLFETPLASQSREGVQAVFNPPLEIIEDADTVSVSVELPGIDKKDVSVSIHEGVLSISGERRQEREAKENDIIRTQRYYGRFKRTLTLTQPILEDKVKATYKDGLLTVTVPKAAEAKPKTIDIATS